VHHFVRACFGSVLVDIDSFTLEAFCMGRTVSCIESGTVSVSDSVKFGPSSSEFLLIAVQSSSVGELCLTALLEGTYGNPVRILGLSANATHEVCHAANMILHNSTALLREGMLYALCLDDFDVDRSVYRFVTYEGYHADAGARNAHALLPIPYPYEEICAGYDTAGDNL
jgi:hypothetical protein